MKKDIRQDVKKRMENFEKMKKDKAPKTKPIKAKLGYTNAWEDADGVAWLDGGSDCIANPSVLIGSVDSFDDAFEKTQKTDNPMAELREYRNLTSTIEELGKKLASKDQPEIQIAPGCLKMSALANAEASAQDSYVSAPANKTSTQPTWPGLVANSKDTWEYSYTNTEESHNLSKDIQSLFTLDKRNDIAQGFLAFDPNKTEEFPNVPSKKKGRESYKEWTVPAKEDTVREVNVNKPKKTIFGATADIYTSKTVEKVGEQDGSTLEPLDIPTAPLIMNSPYPSSYTEPCGPAIAMKDPYPKNVYTLSGKEATDFLNGDIKTQEKIINNCACNSKCEKKQEPLVPGHTNIQMELKNALKQLEYATKDSIVCLLHLSDYTKVEELLKFLYTVSEMNKSYAK